MRRLITPPSPIEPYGFPSMSSDGTHRVEYVGDDGQIYVCIVRGKICEWYALDVTTIVIHEGE